MLRRSGGTISAKMGLLHAGAAQLMESPSNSMTAAYRPTVDDAPFKGKPWTAIKGVKTHRQAFITNASSLSRLTCEGTPAVHVSSLEHSHYKPMTNDSQTIKEQSVSLASSVVLGSFHTSGTSIRAAERLIRWQARQALQRTELNKLHEPHPHLTAWCCLEVPLPVQCLQGMPVTGCCQPSAAPGDVCARLDRMVAPMKMAHCTEAVGTSEVAHYI